MKTVVAYYSFSGNTKAAAKKIADEIGADIMEIQPKKGIPTSGFGKFFIGGMQVVFGIKPKLKNFSFNESEYDRVILGTPIWSGKPASPTNTFLKKLSDKNKVFAVFTFSGGGDNDKCMEYLNKRFPSIKHSAALAGSETSLCEKNDEKLNEFIKAIGNGVGDGE